jgi:uncharacterized Tic20 family protein
MKFPESGEGDMAIEADARNWATLTHLSTLTGYVTAIGFVVGPLVMWLLRKDQWEFIDDQGKEALNFSISVCIYWLVSLVLAFLLIGIPLLFAIGIAHIAFSIVAAVNSSKGIRYRYPLIIRFVN